MPSQIFKVIYNVTICVGKHLDFLDPDLERERESELEDDLDLEVEPV